MTIVQRNQEMTQMLKGKIVSKVRYMTDEEQEGFGFYHKAPVLFFTDGTSMVLFADDEGNDAGAAWIADGDKMDTFYVW